ncbi:MAG: multidrug efflux SMR transporter [Eggerthellaceae bacterium]|nr:multidrug efflux SMR transporter [Eggerthellaceae bacterium]
MNKYYCFLFAAIACEVFGTNMMKASNGFTQPLDTALFVVGYIACFILLTLSLKGLQLGIAYGIWAGVGVAATAVIGVLVWGDPMNAAIVVGVILIVVGVVLLETSQGKKGSVSSNDKASENL